MQINITVGICGENSCLLLCGNIVKMAGKINVSYINGDQARRERIVTSTRCCFSVLNLSSRRTFFVTYLQISRNGINAI